MGDECLGITEEEGENGGCEDGQCQQGDLDGGGHAEAAPDEQEGDPAQDDGILFGAERQSQEDGGGDPAGSVRVSGLPVEAQGQQGDKGDEEGVVPCLFQDEQGDGKGDPNHGQEGAGQR